MKSNPKLKKDFIRLIKLWIISGYNDDLFYTKTINNWIKEDGNENDVMVRSVKLLRNQNKRYMFLLFLFLEYLEN